MPEKPKVVESIINIIVICEKNMYYFRQMCYITREAVGGVFGQVWEGGREGVIPKKVWISYLNAPLQNTYIQYVALYLL